MRLFLIVPVLTALSSVLAPRLALADQALAAKSQCLVCHGIERKQVGPSFKAVAERYANDPTAAERLALKIRTGGVGVWGRVVMPPSTKMSEADAKKLADWVLSLK